MNPNLDFPKKSEPSNIIDIINQIKVLETLRDMHFETKSKLWKAIYDHISTEKQCVLIDREGPILCDIIPDDDNEFILADGDEEDFDDQNVTYQYYIKYQGASPYYKTEEIPKIDDEGIITKDIGEMFILTLAVTYITDNDEYPEFTFPYVKEYSILVPVELETNFTKTKFKSWVNSIHIALNDVIKYNEIQELSRLVNKYKHEIQQN